MVRIESSVNPLRNVAAKNVSPVGSDARSNRINVVASCSTTTPWKRYPFGASVMAEFHLT